jgi:hypothetical protein
VEIRDSRFRVSPVGSRLLSLCGVLRGLPERLEDRLTLADCSVCPSHVRHVLQRDPMV